MIFSTLCLQIAYFFQGIYIGQHEGQGQGGPLIHGQHTKGYSTGWNHLSLHVVLAQLNILTF